MMWSDDLPDRWEDVDDDPPKTDDLSTSVSWGSGRLTLRPEVGEELPGDGRPSAAFIIFARELVADVEEDPADRAG